MRWEILASGGPRLLGLLGGRQARVRVERLVGRYTDARALVVDLLAAMQIPAEVETAAGADGIEVDIRTQGLDGLLIGRRGETLAALQHVIGRLVSKHFGETGRVLVDVGGYRRRHEAALVDKARALAEKVRVTGREISLEPLHAPDRRVVHQALAGVDGIRTYTVGQGLHRNVVIAPAARPRS